MIRTLKIRWYAWRLRIWDGTVRSDAAEALAGFGAVEPLIKALGHGRGDVSEAAANALGELGDPRAVDPLIKALGNRNCAAAWALGEIGDRRAVEPLIKALGDSHHSRVCEGAAAGLAKLGDPRAVEPLIKVLLSGVWSTPVVAAEALGRLGDRRAVEPLIRTLSCGDCRVREAAAAALEKLGGDPRAVEPLIKALGDPGSAGFGRRAAAVALEKLGEPKWKGIVKGDYADWARLGACGDPRAVEPLVKALLSNEHDEFHRAIAGELLKFGGIAVEPLIKAVDDWKSYAAWALGELGDPRAVEPLIKALGGGHWSARKDAAEALGKLADACAVEPLIEALGDGEKVRKAASEALLKLGEPKWKEIVRGDDQDWERLGACGDPRAFKPLIKALSENTPCDDSNYRRCSAAARALGALADRRAVEPLIRALHNGNSAAARALGKLGDRRAVEPLVKTLFGGSYVCNAIAEAIAEALGDLGDPRAVEPLIKTLQIRSWPVGAAEALGKLGDRRAVDPLIEALKLERLYDQDRFLYARQLFRAAAGALGKLGDPRAIEPLTKALGGGVLYGGGERVAAADALEKLGEAKWKQIFRGDNQDWRRLGASGDPQSITLLIKALPSEGTAEALGDLGDSRAVEPLIKALGHGDRDIREAVARALDKLGEPKWKAILAGNKEDWVRLASSDPRAVEPLIKALGDGNWQVRKAAAEVLIAIASAAPRAIGKQWRKVQTLVMAPHEVVNDSDVDLYYDRGIGLDFPNPPRSLDL